MSKLHLLTTMATICAAGLLNAADATGKTTLENLQAAFNGESNANAKYTAFAAKAEAEGYKSVATLFRATAMSEGIHAKKHAAVIVKMGAVPKADIAQPDVKSTKENLEAALAGETYEKGTMYPSARSSWSVPSAATPHSTARRSKSARSAPCPARNS